MIFSLSRRSAGSALPRADIEADQVGQVGGGAGLSLLAQLSAEYPEVSGRALAETVARADTVGSALVGGAEISRERQASLARDRLDVIRFRSAAPSRRVPRVGRR